MWSDNADIFKKKKEWMESGVTMQTFLNKEIEWGVIMQTNGQYRHFVWGHQRRRRLYERRCRRFGDLYCIDLVYVL